MMSFTDTKNPPISQKGSWVNPFLNSAATNSTNVKMTTLTEPISYIVILPCQPYTHLDNFHSYKTKFIEAISK